MTVERTSEPSARLRFLAALETVCTLLGILLGFAVMVLA